MLSSAVTLWCQMWLCLSSLSDQLQIQEGLRDRGHILEDTGSAGSVVQAIARSHYFLYSQSHLFRCVGISSTYPSQ